MSEIFYDPATLCDRLRGVYRVPIRDGLGAVGGDEPNNPDQFVRSFTTPPIWRSVPPTASPPSKPRTRRCGSATRNWRRSTRTPVGFGRRMIRKYVILIRGKLRMKNQASPLKSNAAASLRRGSMFRCHLILRQTPRGNGILQLSKRRLMPSRQNARAAQPWETTHDCEAE